MLTFKERYRRGNIRHLVLYLTSTFIILFTSFGMLSEIWIGEVRKLEGPSPYHDDNEYFKNNGLNTFSPHQQSNKVLLPGHLFNLERHP